MKILSTPGFLNLNLPLEVTAAAVRPLLNPGREPSWVVGDPKVKAQQFDDEGRTLRIPAPKRFWAIRDDHPERCDCGCDGGSVITLLLPEEY